MGSRWVQVVAPVLLVAGLALAGCDGPAKATSASPGAAGPSATPSAAESASSAVGVDPAVAPAPAKPKVSKATLDYFFQIAFGDRDPKDATIAMWTNPFVLVHLSGTVSAASRTCADRRGRRRLSCAAGKPAWPAGRG